MKVYFVAGCSLKTAAEKLYIHKNTPQYQLDKIHVLTGYDLRVFREGVILYLGLQLGLGNTEANATETTVENILGTTSGFRRSEPRRRSAAYGKRKKKEKAERGKTRAALSILWNRNLG